MRITCSLCGLQGIDHQSYRNHLDCHADEGEVITPGIVYLSFTDTLKSLHRDAPGYRIIQMHKPEVRLAFGCARSHVIREDGLVPFEVSWNNEHMPSQYGGENKNGERCTGIDPVKTCEPAARSTWNALCALTRAKDHAGLVDWRCGNYHEARVKALIEGHYRVYYWGQCATNDDLPELLKFV